MACGLTMVALYPRLLQAQPPAEDAASDYFLEAAVRADSTLVGKTVEAGGLHRLGHLFPPALLQVLGVFDLAPSPQRGEGADEQRPPGRTDRGEQ